MLVFSTGVIFASINYWMLMGVLLLDCLQYVQQGH